MFKRGLVRRITGLFVRWDLVRHPYGRDYAVQQYSPTGERLPPTETIPAERKAGRRAGLMALSMVLLSLLATGLLFSPF